MSRLASRHVYQPPRGNRPLNIAAAIVGGLVFTFLVFYVIPLMQKLEGKKEEVTTTMEAAYVEEAPEDFELEEEPPPPEEEPEPEPELNLETEPMDIADIPFDLGAGVGGKMMLNLKPNFEVADDPNALGGGDLDTPPRPTSKPPPRYPGEMLKKKQGGKVLVLVTVDERGVVTNASVKESSGFQALDQAALNAAKRWKFKPGIKGGRKAVMTATIPFNFRVKT
ncbi:energy transducer TonB [Roseibacillus ishigakijimensis]|uniref:Energy transducer TonB n=1 Tax=Roseibacillus ishigakijimensis TaxID=454146 RepID=A0A934VMI1_9BACT|nr:energy transducer TonB [Roseibacillus ishigakijimensis]MBK1833975.1 energy transducer TonB [Roseibacillus ishigakijimensis]